MKSIKDKIKSSFSKAAKTYDVYSNIQNEIGEKTLSLLPTKDDEIKNILEIGCGTGNYTTKLLLRINQKNKLNIHLIDFSKEMIKEARKKLIKVFPEHKFYFHIEDAENTSFLKENITFDLITSNSTFQWLFNFKTTINYYITLLNKKGILLFSIFGNKTFIELNNSIKIYLENKEINLPASRFSFKKERLRNLTNLTNIQIKEETIKYEYPSLMELLKHIKNTGEYANGLNNKIVFTKNIIKKIEKIYLDKYKRIIATYHFYIFYGEKR